MSKSFNWNTWNRLRYTFYTPFYDIVAGIFSTYRKRSIDSLSIKEGSKVLILGAGSGLDLEYLPKNIDITAIDITPSMIVELKKKAQEQRLEVDAQVMDGSNLKFEDSTFDYVVLHLILAVIPDPIACIKETERVLKPGGKATIMDKFIPDSKSTRLVLYILNPFTNLLATNLTRDINSILSNTNLTKNADIKLRSIFRCIEVQKNSQ